VSEPYNSDDEVLARLVREAGDPGVAPDPQFAETLRATILDRVATAEADAIPNSVERTRPMRRILRYVVAATVLVAAGIWISWMTAGGGSKAMAFSRIADALDNLRSATYDITVTSTQEEGENGNPPATVTATGKGYFLAPSYQRMEIAVETPEHTTDKATIPKQTFEQITIADSQAAKCLMLNATFKLATLMDMNKVRGDMEKSGNSVPPDLFDMVRRLVRDGSSGTGEEVQTLGAKEIDGHKAVGFKTKSEMGDMILWADPETAWPVRIEISGEIMANVHMVMSGFRHDVELAPSLFSLDPPEGYSTQTVEVVTPVEQDLLNTLRTIAENSEGLFPAKLALNKEVMEALMTGMQPATDQQAQERMEAVMNEVAAKYGGKEEMRKKYGKKIPPEIMEEFNKAMAPMIQEQIQKNMPIQQKRMRGLTFYSGLKSENDPHYVGGGVKLGTPDCPILWYKPTGTDNYRVVYADLSVKDMTPGEVKELADGASR
jgi:outer membrane lipoprotein-sorting protein